MPKLSAQNQMLLYRLRTIEPLSRMTDESIVIDDVLVPTLDDLRAVLGDENAYACDYCVVPAPVCDDAVRDTVSRYPLVTFVDPSIGYDHTESYYVNLEPPTVPLHRQITNSDSNSNSNGTVSTSKSAVYILCTLTAFALYGLIALIGDIIALFWH